MTEEFKTTEQIRLAMRWYLGNGMQVALDCEKPNTLSIYPHTNRKWKKDWYVQLSKEEIAYRAELQKEIEDEEK